MHTRMVVHTVHDMYISYTHTFKYTCHVCVCVVVVEGHEEPYRVALFCLV